MTTFRKIKREIIPEEKAYDKKIVQNALEEFNKKLIKKIESFGDFKLGTPKIEEFQVKIPVVEIRSKFLKTALKSAEFKYGFSNINPEWLKQGAHVLFDFEFKSGGGNGWSFRYYTKEDKLEHSF
jgi:hypothetical protein